VAPLRPRLRHRRPPRRRNGCGGQPWPSRTGRAGADDGRRHDPLGGRVARRYHAAERGRARLRRYVTTEQVQQAVPVRRDRVRLEREPITDAATSGPDISEAEHEVVLREEEPVVQKRAVPKERVRLDTETVTDERQVSEEIRKEQIEVDDEDTEVGRHERRPRR
jgi:uncharacterized protein (TIGR02271 family)